MYRLTLSLAFLLLLFVSSVNADDWFLPDGDQYYNKYFDTLGYSVGNIPDRGECPNCLEYDTALLEGVSTSNVLSDYGLYDVASVGGYYGLNRKVGVLDRVALPPRSTLDFIYWGFNNTGDSVNIDSLKVFLSRYNDSDGDLSKVLDVSGVREDIRIMYTGFWYKRGGLAKTYPGLGIVQYSGTPLNPVVIDSIRVSQPLVFRDWKYERHGDGAKVEISVENTSKRAIPNVVFSHSSYEEIHSFAPREKHTFVYELRNVDGGVGLASISDSNSVEECVVYSETLESQVVGDSSPLIGMRGVKPYVGSRVLSVPMVPSFCVKRIPYILYSGEMGIVEENLVDDESNNEVETTEEVEFSDSEVLGIKNLPQTSVSDSKVSHIVGVVAIIFLWYYLLRRFVYES